MTSQSRRLLSCTLLANEFVQNSGRALILLRIFNIVTRFSWFVILFVLHPCKYMINAHKWRSPNLQQTLNLTHIAFHWTLLSIMYLSFTNQLWIPYHMGETYKFLGKMCMYILVIIVLVDHAGNLIDHSLFRKLYATN